MPRSFRARLSITVLLLLALSLGVMGAWLTAEFRVFYMARVEESLVRQARLLELLVRDNFTPEHLRALAPRTGGLDNVRVTFLSPVGLVWGESTRDAASLGDHSDRPEVIMALAGEIGVHTRVSATLGVPMLYVAVPVRDVAGAMQGVVRVALDLTAMDAGFARVNFLAVSGGIVALLIGGVLALAHAQAVSEPLHKMSEVALEIAGGNIACRADVAGPTEIRQLAQALNAMAHNLEGELSRVQFAAEKLQAVLGSLRDGVLLIDNKENIELVNAAAAEMLAFSPAATIGQRDTMLLRHPELSELLRLAKSERSACHKRIVLSGQTARHIRAAVLPLEGGRIMIVLQDLTEVYTAVDSRRDFVANVSHELRTPLTSLGLMVENLLRGALEERDVAKDFLRRMAGEIERLTEMVLDLLQLSRLESGTEELHKGRVVVSDLVREVVAGMSGLLDSKEQVVVVLGESKTELWGDRDKVRRVLINLLDNASKFSPAGSRITIGLRAHAKETEVYISDQGPGILPEHLPRVFERFFKSSASRGGGTGLGLAIVKHIIEAHGGSVYVRSRLGEGATLGFTVPNAASERQL